MVFRDQERGNKASIAFNCITSKTNWLILDLDDQPLDRWEPTMDNDLWAASQLLNLFIQPVSQSDGEKVDKKQERAVNILEWSPFHLSPF